MLSNGQLDTNFLAGVTNFSAYNQAVIRTIAIQENGRILAGGNFLTFGPFRNGLARFNADGTPDTSFIYQQAIGDDYNANVYRIALFADGRIVVAGSYATWEGITENSLTILTGDPIPLAFAAQPFSQFVPSGTSVQFSAVAVGTPTISYQWFRDGTPLTDGGKFTGANTATLSIANATASEAANYTVQISNGSGSRLSSPAELFILAAPVVRTQPIGGTYYVSNSVSLRATVLGLTPMSVQWYIDTIGAIPNATNQSLSYTNLVLTNSGSYYLVASNNLGMVTSAVAKVTVLPLPAALSPTFTNPAGANSTVYAIAPVGDGRVVIGGFFTFAGQGGNQTARVNMAMLNTNGTVDATFNPAPNQQVSAIVRDGAGGYLVGGQFNSIAGQSRNFLARLNSDGSLDTNFVANLGSGPNNLVYDIVLQPDGKILVGGTFGTVSGQSYPSIVRLNSNGTIDNSFRLNIASPQQIQAIAVRNDGKIYVGGFITVSNRQNILRLEANGAIDLAFNASANSAVARTIVAPDDGVYIGGNFNTINGVTASSFAKLNIDGSRDTSWAQPNGSVEAMRAQANGKVVIGGQFFNVGSATRTRIARYNTDGTLDTTFGFTGGGGFSGNVKAIALESDGRIWVGGGFTTYNSVAVNNLVLLNGDPVTFNSGNAAFDTWAAANGLTPANAGFGLDPDGDGIPNIFEWYFGTAPANGGSSSRPASGSVISSGQLYPAVTFVRVKNLTGLTLLAQASPDVTFATDMGTVVESVVDQGNGTELVTVRSSVSAATQPNQFLRIKVSVP